MQNDPMATIVQGLAFLEDTVSDAELPPGELLLIWR
jgi:hypothetical protein